MKHIVPTSKLSTKQLFLSLSEWCANIEHKGTLSSKYPIPNLARELMWSDVREQLCVHFSRGFMLMFVYLIFTSISFFLFFFPFFPFFPQKSEEKQKRLPVALVCL